MPNHDHERAWPACVTQSPPSAALRHPLAVFAAALGPARPARPPSPPPVTASILPTPLPALPGNALLRRPGAPRPPDGWRGFTPEPLFADFHRR